MTQKTLYARRIEQGLCGLCGGDNPDKTAICSTCSDKQKQRYNANRSKGGCYICGEPTTEPGSAYCEKHYERRMALREQRKKIGICYECGKQAGMDHGKRCELCFFRNIARKFQNISGEQLQKLFEFQKKTCPLSGRTLVPGYNAHLDHIVPRSKGGSNEIENLRWVDKSVNYAKRDLSDDDFLRLVKEVYAYTLKD